MSKFRRSLKHRRDHSIDEKISRANKEYEKTGIVISEGPTNTTSGVYFATDHIPLVPAVTDTVPDTSGVTGSGFTQPTNGDPSNSSNWNASGAYTDTSWMFNSNEVGGVTGRPIVASIDPSVISAYQASLGEGDTNLYPSGAGIVRGFIANGTAVGYLSNGIFTTVLTPSLVGGTNLITATSGYGFGTNYFPATPERVQVLLNMVNKYVPLRDAYDRGEITTKTIKCWVQWSNFHNGDFNAYNGAKFSVGSNYYYLRDMEIFTEPFEYEVSPEVPARTLVLYRTGLDNVDFQKIGANLFGMLKGLYGLGKRALDYLIGNYKDNTEGMGEDLKAHWGKTFQQVKNFINDLFYLGGGMSDQSYGLFDGVNNLYAISSVVYDARKNGDITADNKIREGAKGSISNPHINTVSDAVAAHILKGVDIGGKDMGKQIQQNVSASPLDGTGNWGSKGIHNNLPGMGVNSDQYPSPEVNDGSVEIPDTFLFSKRGFLPAKYSPTGMDQEKLLGGSNAHVKWIVQGLADAKYFKSRILGKSDEDAKIDAQNRANSIAAAFDKSIGIILPLTVGPNDPLVHFRTVISQEQIERIRGRGLIETRNMNEKLSKMVKVAIPGPKDELTVKAIDMIKLHKLNQQEVDEYVQIISSINQWIRDNPKEYEIWKVRYPANDPRLAELNWKLDSQMRASEEYMEKHFSENQRLFKKVQQSIAKNIEMTDPKSFKGVRVPKFKGVDLTDYKRRKAVVSRHYKKAVKIRSLFSRKKT